MKGWALALLHLSLEDFGRLRLPEFWAAMAAYSEEKALDRQHVAELVRGATLRLWNLQVKKPITDPVRFWRMPYDIQENPEAADEIAYLNSCSDEERSRLAKQFIDSLNNGD